MEIVQETGGVRELPLDAQTGALVGDDEGEMEAPPVPPAIDLLTALQTAFGGVAALAGGSTGLVVSQTELELEQGLLVWEVKLLDALGQPWRAEVDATTGAFLGAAIKTVPPGHGKVKGLKSAKAGKSGKPEKAAKTGRSGKGPKPGKGGEKGNR